MSALTTKLCSYCPQTLKLREENRTEEGEAGQALLCYCTVRGVVVKGQTLLPERSFVYHPLSDWETECKWQ